MVSISATFYVQIFHTNDFFLCTCNEKKLPNAMFVQKICTFNVDEIELRNHGELIRSFFVQIATFYILRMLTITISLAKFAYQKSLSRIRLLYVLFNRKCICSQNYPDLTDTKRIETGI